MATYNETVQDQFNVSEINAALFGRTLSETLNLTHDVGSNGIQSAEYSDSLTLEEFIRKGFAGLLVDTLQCADGVERAVVVLKKLSDRLRMRGSEGSNATIGVLLQDSTVLQDLIAYGFAGVVSEALDLSQNLDTLSSLYNGLNDRIDINDVTALELAVYCSREDGLGVSTVLDTRATLGALVEDGLMLGITFSDGNEAYTGWVLNTRHAGVAQYENYNFNSFHRFNGKYLAAGSGGVFELGGDLDETDTIQERLLTGIFAPDEGRMSRLPEMFIGARSDGKIVIKAISSDKTEYWYESQTPRDGLTNLRVKMGKGVRAKYWQFELLNTDGSDLDLESIELLPVVVTRRV